MNAVPESPDAALQDAIDAIAHADQVVLGCHVNPDGDALGSTLGMLHTLRAAGRDAIATFPNPFVVAPHYRDLPGLDLLTPPEAVPAEPELDDDVRLRLARPSR